MTINLSDVINETLPGVVPSNIGHASYTVYLPLDITALLIINILYCAIMDKRIAWHLFGDFSGPGMRNKILRGMFGQREFYQHMILINLVCLLLTIMAPYLGLAQVHVNETMLPKNSSLYHGVYDNLTGMNGS